MSAGSIEIISPEDGDGETYYYEVTRYGEIWDGRSATYPEALKDSAVLLESLIQMQNETGRNHERALP